MEWLNYLLKVSACMVLLYALYHIAFRKLSFLSLNRYYLLFSLIISFLVPVLQMEIESQINVQRHVETVGLPMHNHTSNSALAVAQDRIQVGTYEWSDLLPMLYWVVAFSYFAIFIYRMVHLTVQMRKISNKSGRLKIIHKSTGFTNCSFLNYVFLDQQNLQSNELDVILKHESIHAKNFHSLDKLFMQCCQAILWFNPIIYLYGKALEQAHEYEADRETSMLIGPTQYAKTLLAIAVHKNHSALLHSFVRNQVKARINRLFTNQSKNMKKLTYLFTLPVAMGLVALFGVEVVYAKTAASSLKPVEIGQPADKKEEKNQEIQTSVKSQKIVSHKIAFVSEEQDQDTIRMVGRDAGPNPKVTIDGIDYPADVLTKISPRCISTTSSYSGAIKITTHNNKIEYATETDIQNAKAEISAEKSTVPFIRYTLKNEDGKKFDRVKVRAKGGSASLDVPNDGKVLILIGGKSYSEKDAKKLSAADFEGSTSVSASGSLSNYAQYGTDYHGLIEIKKE